MLQLCPLEEVFFSILYSNVYNNADATSSNNWFVKMVDI